MEFFYILLGLCIGIFSGIFGIGGGFILTPVLILFGIPPLSAIGTSLMYSIGTSVSGVAAHLRFKNILWKPAAVLGVVGIGATQVAHPLVVWSEKMGYDDTIIPIFYIVLLAYFALSLLYKQTKRKNKTQITTEIQFSWQKAVFIGFTGGFISTTLGVGGGFVMVPMLISLMKFPSRKAVGTSLVSVFFIVSAGFLTYASSVQIDYKLGLLLILGALVGTQLGAKLTTIYSSEQIQKYLGALYITILSSVVLKLVHLDKAGLGIITLYVLSMLVLFLKETITHTKRKTSTS